VQRSDAERLAKVQEDHAKAVTRVRQLKELLETARNERQAALAKAAQAEGKASAAQGRVAATEADLKVVLEELRLARRKEADATAAARSLQDALARKEQQERDAAAAAAAAQAEAARLQAEARRNEAALAQSEGQAARAQQEAAALRMQLAGREAEILDLRFACDGYVARIETLKGAQAHAQRAPAVNGGDGAARG
jgi:chromosome segregation ATPase